MTRTGTPPAAIFCTSHRGPMHQTDMAMKATGLPHYTVQGVSDTALARNLCFSSALNMLETGQLDVDVLVFVDDDMTFTPEGVSQLVDSARTMNEAVSAFYLLADGRGAARCIKKADDWVNARWYAGLGLMAVPVARLRALRDESEKLKAQKDLPPIYAMTWSGPHEGEWMSEDYRFCHRLGGIIVAPIGAGHLKMQPILPHADSLTLVASGGNPPKVDPVGVSDLRIEPTTQKETHPQG